MRRSFLGRAIPATLTAAGVAVPSATAALVMLHSMLSGSGTESGFSASSSGSSVASAAKPAPAKATVAPTSPPAAAKPAPTRATTRTVSGPVVYDRYGGVQATITVSGKKITNVSIAAPQDDPRSASINQQTVPLLRSETLQAQSANINLLSGATETSDAYIQSLQSALRTAGV